LAGGLSSEADGNSGVPDVVGYQAMFRGVPNEIDFLFYTRTTRR
jgi:hypothetical protein